MSNYSNIETHLDNGIFTLTLNREQKRNAINEQTMDELLEALKAFPASGVKAAILQGKGRDFCAGADLQWMRTTQQMDEKALQQQNMKLQKVFELWHSLPAFTIAMVQGNTVGGGLGLMAASDFVLASPGARFRFSEVTLGLMPATIAPFILQRTHNRFIRNAMLTAMPFDADKALQTGLVDMIADQARQKVIADEYIHALNKTDEQAVSKTKKLANDLMMNRISEPLDVYTTTLLARVRKSASAARRIAAFFKNAD